MTAQPLASSHGPLQFSDSLGCKRWIDQLTLTNVQLTQRLLTTQLAALGGASLAPLERLKILETLREAVHFVQAESAKRYAGRPLPLEAGESAVWDNVLGLWQEASRNYQQCL
jgi:hypothetical protein